ncbi:MAG: hypothetical protein RLZZ271_1467 [Pseudomonadota bacterium]|jgi:hypothetical protein
MYRSQSKRVFATCLAIFLLSGCDDPVAKKDATTKQALIGRWTVQLTEPQKGAVTLLQAANDGSFQWQHEANNYAGEWFVTAGLLKLLVKNEDGKPLANSDFGYFTCRVANMQEQGFSCVNDIERKTWAFKRH